MFVIPALDKRKTTQEIIILLLKLKNSVLENIKYYLNLNFQQNLFITLNLIPKNIPLNFNVFKFKKKYSYLLIV